MCDLSVKKWRGAQPSLADKRTAVYGFGTIRLNPCEVEEFGNESSAKMRL